MQIQHFLHLTVDQLRQITLDLLASNLCLAGNRQKVGAVCIRFFAALLL